MALAWDRKKLARHPARSSQRSRNHHPGLEPGPNIFLLARKYSSCSLHQSQSQSSLAGEPTPRRTNDFFGIRVDGLQHGSRFEFCRRDCRLASVDADRCKRTRLGGHSRWTPRASAFGSLWNPLFGRNFRSAYFGFRLGRDSSMARRVLGPHDPAQDIFQGSDSLCGTLLRTSVDRQRSATIRGMGA